MIRVHCDKCYRIIDHEQAFMTCSVNDGIMIDTKILCSECMEKICKDLFRTNKEQKPYVPKPCYACPINMRCPDGDMGCTDYREWKEKNHD